MPASSGTPANRRPQGQDLPKRKPGGQPGNKSGWRHGLRSSSLPDGLKYVEISLNKFRRALEAAVLAAHNDEIDIPSAAAIQTCCRFERAALLHERRYRLDPAKWPDSPDKAAIASQQRDKAIERLRIGHNGKDSLIEALYARFPALTKDKEDETT